MIKDPRITVATMIEHNGKFLLVEEVCNGEVVFNQPAGHVEQNETFAQAALRETLEETAWRVELNHFLGIYVLPMPRSGLTYYRFCYVATALEQTDYPLDKEIVAAHWLTYEEVLERRDQLRSELVLQCIEDFRCGIRLPLSTVKEFGVINS